MKGLDLGFFRSWFRSMVMGDLQTHGDGGELQVGRSGCVWPPLHVLLIEEPTRLRKPLEVQLTSQSPWRARQGPVELFSRA